MESVDKSSFTLIRSYFAALEEGAVGEELARFFTSDAQQIEFPNRLNQSGGKSDLARILCRAEQGQKLLREQRFEILSLVTQGHLVAAEANWSAVLAIPLGSLPAGHIMRAHLAIFFELRASRIAVQRNYDCFEPW